MEFIGYGRLSLHFIVILSVIFASALVRRFHQDFQKTLFWSGFKTLLAQKITGKITIKLTGKSRIVNKFYYVIYCIRIALYAFVYANLVLSVFKTPVFESFITESLKFVSFCTAWCVVLYVMEKSELLH